MAGDYCQCQSCVLVMTFCSDCIDVEKPIKRPELARVIRAISDRCARAVAEAHNEIQEQILEQRMARRMRQRQGMGQSV